MHKVLVWIALFTVTQPACKRRSQNEIQKSDKQTSSADTTENNLDQLKLERNALIAQLEAQKVEGARKIAELTLERDELTVRVRSVELDITRLEKELAGATTPEQKEQVQLKLTAAVRERDDLNKKLETNSATIKELLKTMDALSEEIRKANSRISDLNDRIESLEKQLSVERSKVETISVSTFPKPSAETSAPNSTGTATPTGSPTPSATPTPTPTSTTNGVLSQIAWQFYRKNADTSLSCFEFGSTLANASLLGLTCVTPAPIRQQFKTETYGSQFLIIDQRTQMCVRLETTAAVAGTARIILGACKRGGDMDELWSFTNVNTDTAEFQFKSVKTGNCLHIADDRKVVQTPCAQASNLLSVP